MILPEPAWPGSGRTVTFESVRFGYRQAIVLPGLDLVIPAGQTAALVGATGAGKTTIARLLARFYDPVSGVIRLDGVDLRQLSDRSLRAEVIMITQENFLFSGTIAENIELGKPGASRAEVTAAAAAIGAHEFIAALPDGYDSGSASAAAGCPRASASSSRSRARSSPAPRCSCWTRPPRCSTSPASGWCRTRCGPSWPGAPR